ncbi:MAG: prolyl oligopeptidase family serine peptidase [Bryobacteraceae bacterium]
MQQIAVSHVIHCMIFFLAAQLVLSQSDGTILKRSAHQFAPYSQIPGIQRYATEKEQSGVLADKRFALERLVYSSGGLQVVAYLYHPVEKAESKYPVIIFNRGGYRDTNISLYATMFHRLAAAGFVIVAPMLRGSEGAPGEDEVGGADLQDVLSASRLAAQLDYADTSNLFLYGESRGGMMTYQAIREGFPARAAAVVGAYTDQAALLDGQPQLKQLTDKLWAREKPDEALQRRSARRWPEKISIPILIQHGAADQSVNPLQSIQMAGKLQELHRPYQLVVYDDDGHVLTRNREQRDSAVIAWFRIHMLRTGMAVPK